MRDLGPVKHMLGMRVTRHEDKISIDQTHYINKILLNFQMNECKPTGTPMELTPRFGEKENVANVPYQQLIGCLTYLASCTRPDIAHAVSKLAQFNSRHTQEHWTAAKRVLRYLQGTKELQLTFRATGKELYGYTDADWAGSTADRRSYTGFVFILGGGAVAWESRKQRTVALSSAEAEYMALTEGTKEGLFLRSVLNEICQSKMGSIPIYSDSQSAQCLTSNFIINNRTKHIDVRHHFIRDAVDTGLVAVLYVSTNLMVADLLTKPLGKIKHKFCSDNMGLK